ncbi:MAG: hypothetical protein MJ252_21795 [archaeon]|nr:hypothetical protein [archaeon]
MDPNASQDSQNILPPDSQDFRHNSQRSGRSQNDQGLNYKSIIFQIPFTQIESLFKSLDKYDKKNNSDKYNPKIKINIRGPKENLTFEIQDAEGSVYLLSKPQRVLGKYSEDDPFLTNQIPLTFFTSLKNIKAIFNHMTISPMLISFQYVYDTDGFINILRVFYDYEEDKGDEEHPNTIKKKYYHLITPENKPSNWRDFVQTQKLFTAQLKQLSELNSYGTKLIPLLKKSTDKSTVKMDIKFSKENKSCKFECSPDFDGLSEPEEPVIFSIICHGVSFLVEDANGFDKNYEVSYDALGVAYLLSSIDKNAEKLDLAFDADGVMSFIVTKDGGNFIRNMSPVMPNDDY